MPSELPIVAKLKAEKTEFQRELNVEIPRLLEEARAHGDLSENAEYDAAKDRQGILMARIGHLTERLAALSRYDISSIPTDVIGYGSRVEVEDCDSGDQAVYEVVFPEEADPPKGLVSMAAPLGQALLEKQAGDEVTVQLPSGSRTLAVLSVTTFHER